MADRGTVTMADTPETLKEGEESESTDTISLTLRESARATLVTPPESWQRSRLMMKSTLDCDANCPPAETKKRAAATRTAHSRRGERQRP